MRAAQKYQLFALCLFAFLVWFYNWGFSSNPPLNQPRFKPTGLNSHFTLIPGQSYQNYLVAERQRIGLARQKGGAHASLERLAQIGSQEFIPDPTHCPKGQQGTYAKGVLYIHGFTDTPYAFYALAKNFQDHCVLVRTLLLPGHGSVPGDLLEVRYQDWQKAVAFAIDSFHHEVDDLYLSGFSLGGLLAVDAALDQPKRIKGLILFAPLTQFTTPYLGAEIRLRYAWSRVIPRLEWVAIHADTAPTFYESMPINPVYQIDLLLAVVASKEVKQPLDLPLFMVQSAQDAAVDPLANLEMFKRNTHPESTLLWYTNAPGVLKIGDQRVSEQNSAVAQLDLLSSAHTALFLPKSDPLYGEAGSYHYCLQYEEDSPPKQQCLSAEPLARGEIIAANLERGTMRRLLYNPFYPAMLTALNRFIFGK